MKKVLIVSRSQQGIASLSELLKSENYTQIQVSENTESAKMLGENDEFDLICINAPLSDETGIELSEHFARTTKACVVIIVSQKNADNVNHILMPQGVLVISKPINTQLFRQNIQFAECFRQRIIRFYDENNNLKDLVEDIKIISRAKCLLISCLNMSEQQAHRYIEKQAMDLRVSKYQVAKQVIKTYENQFDV